LIDRHISLNYDETVLDYLVEKGYDRVYGARPLKRYIQRNLETALAKAIISGDVVENSAVNIQVVGEHIQVRSV
jgi:ATP-dependent Clp protease ATP-binding subunit ClpB